MTATGPLTYGTGADRLAEILALMKDATEKGSVGATRDLQDVSYVWGEGTPVWISTRIRLRERDGAREVDLGAQFAVLMKVDRYPPLHDRVGHFTYFGPAPGNQDSGVSKRHPSSGLSGPSGPDSAPT